MGALYRELALPWFQVGQDAVRKAAADFPQAHPGQIDRRYCSPPLQPPRQSPLIGRDRHHENPSELAPALLHWPLLPGQVNSRFCGSALQSAESLVEVFSVRALLSQLQDADLESQERKAVCLLNPKSEIRIPQCSYLTMPNIGEWFVSRTLPLPRYICTPHGRHGSKLLTVRMMSIPLKFAGPFSSKIGVFCTASS